MWCGICTAVVNFPEKPIASGSTQGIICGSGANVSQRVRFSICFLYVIVVDVELDMWSDAVAVFELYVEGVEAIS
jgi:hypothetical protein